MIILIGLGGLFLFGCYIGTRFDKNTNDKLGAIGFILLVVWNTLYFSSDSYADQIKLTYEEAKELGYDAYKTKEDALLGCQKKAEEALIEFPESIKALYKNFDCNGVWQEFGTYWSPVGSGRIKGESFQLDDVSKKDYVVIIEGWGFNGSAGSLHTFYFYNPSSDSWENGYETITQGYDYDENLKSLVFGKHGSECNQVGAKPCFFQFVYDRINKAHDFKDITKGYLPQN